MEYINLFVNYCTEIITNGGFLIGMIIVILESIIPIMPLGIFIALNANAFGLIPGIIISWIATCIGCFISYTLFYYLSDKLEHLFSKKLRRKIEKNIDKYQKIELSKLVVILTLPFTPAFVVNIICGMIRLNRKKFITAILIGKIFVSFFWAYIGKSLIESISDISTLITIAVMIVIAYGLSKLIGKETKIN